MLEKKRYDIIPNGGEIQKRSDFKRKVVFQTTAFSGDMFAFRGLVPGSLTNTLNLCISW